MQVTSSLDSLDHQYFYKEIACVQRLLSLNVFLHHEQTGPPAHVCLQIYMEKNIGITMVAQVCVLTLFPCSFQDLVALMSQRTGTLVPLQDDEQKSLLRRQLGGFRDECHKQILADNLEI